MRKRELQKRIIIRVILESKKLVKDVRDSVSPGSQAETSLDGVETFIERVHQEMTEHVVSRAGRVLAKLAIDLCHTMLLSPMKELSQWLWAQAVMVISQILKRT